MPGQAGTRGAAADQFIRHDRMEIMHRIGLHGRRVLPIKSEGAETAPHFADGEPDFLFQSVRTEVAVAHDTLGITAAAAAQFGAAGDYECRRRARTWGPFARARERECVE